MILQYLEGIGKVVHYHQLLAIFISNLEYTWQFQTTKDKARESELHNFLKQTL